MEDTRIYYFSAKWCGPCKTFKPVMEKLEEKGYPIYFVDIDEDQILAESHQMHKLIESMNFSESIKDKLFYQNALDWLGLSESRFK